MTFLALIAIIFFGFAVYNLTCAFVDIPTKKTSQMMMLSRKQQGTPSTSGIRKASWGAALSGYILPCEDWREKSTDSATPITAAGGVWMGVPPPCPSGSRHLTLLMAANSSSRRKVPHSKLPSSMQMVQRSSASIGVKRTWQPS